MTDAATTSTTAEPAAQAAVETATAKVVELRAKVQEGADALNGWAHDQARAITATARDRPLAAAGISAGAAFAAGLVLGLLLTRAAPEPNWKQRFLDLKPNW